jgi:uncharacterized protein
MGDDHPVIWTNQHMKAWKVYKLMGHHPESLHSSAFTTIFRSAILRAAHQ